MKLVCPSCGATNSADGITSDVDARAALLVAAELPADLGPLCIRYLGLFRPGKRALAWDRARRLLDELAEQIRAGTIRRRGRDWPVPVGAWRSALQTMLDKRDSLDLPLKSHGYLLEIVAGLSDRAEAQAERAAEQQLQAGGSQVRKSRDIDPERSATHKANVRTAVSLLASEISIARERFGEVYDHDKKCSFLQARGFAIEVINEAILTWKRQEALR